MGSLSNRFDAFVRRIAKGQLRERLKSARSIARRIRRVFTPRVDARSLASDLRRGGIVPGDVIVVHSSLASIGHIEGGPEAVVKALMEAVTPEGTILMPAFCAAEEAFEKSRRGEFVDLRTMGSVNGRISESFLRVPGVRRSSHPFSPMSAWGKHAEHITSGHDRDYKITHRDSPLARLMEFGGKSVGIGTTMATQSFYHVVEDTWEDFPHYLYRDPETITYIDAGGETVTRQVAYYDREKTRVRIDNEMGVAVREFFECHMRRRGIRHDFRFGNASAFWMPVTALYQEMQHLARAGITIYTSAEELRRSERDLTY